MIPRIVGWRVLGYILIAQTVVGYVVNHIVRQSNYSREEIGLHVTLVLAGMLFIRPPWLMMMIEAIRRLIVAYKKPNQE